MADRALKIAAYNILDGGLGRLDPIYETLLYLDADVIGLCEADDPKGVKYLADKLGMDHLCAEGQNGHAVAILSRRPIARMTNLGIRCDILDRGAMEVLVEVSPMESPLRVVVLHLQAGQSREDEQKRLGQLEAALTAMRDHAMPTVLMGDLNAAAAYHPFEYDAASPKVRKRLAERGNGQQLDHLVTSRLQSDGWIDAYHRVHPNTAKHTYTTGFPCTRFDYIWLSGDLADHLLEADVEQGGFAPYCSDHYPIWATIRTPNAKESAK